MKRLIILVSLLVFAGGCQTPLPELNYRGSLKSDVTDAFAAADQFANVLAQETHLKIKDRTRPLRVARMDSSATVELRSIESDRVWIRVTVYTSDHMLVTTIAGDFSSPTAMEIARASERVFARLYPGASYVPFQAYQGLFAP